MRELENKIKEIIGCSAFANDMEVPEDIQKLARATRYLATQIRIVCGSNEEDTKNVDSIIKETIDILK